MGRPLPLPPFRARFPWYGGDLQTLRNTVAFRQPALNPGTRLILPLPDGDKLWAIAHPPAVDIGRPLVVLVHGLTGDEDSANILTSAAWHLGRGHPVLRLNMRGAGPSRATSRLHYNAGRSADLEHGLRALPADLTRRGIVVAGVSLGGNVVLKFLAETGNPAVIAGISTCAPIDLKAAQLRIMAPRNRIYHHHLLTAMKADAGAAPGIQHDLFAAAARRITSIYAFDDLLVAPAGGFDGAEDYYRRSSAGPLLDHITVPTLVIHAADDPWIPAAMYLARAWPATGPLTLALAPGGGHVGFHGRGSVIPWHDRAAGLFIDQLTV